MPRHSVCLYYHAAAQSHKKCHITNSTRKLGLKGAKSEAAGILDFWEHLGVFGYARACFVLGIELGFGVAKRFGLPFLVFPLLFHSLLLFMFVLMYILMDLLNMSG